jgi:hypothetical protein
VVLAARPEIAFDSDVVVVPDGFDGVADVEVAPTQFDRLDDVE